MEYINEININEAVIHILDRNASEPVLNEFTLELNDDVYKYLYKHLEKCFKDEELKSGVFIQGTNSVKETVQGYLNGIDDDFIELSKRLSRQMFAIMQMDENIESCDLIIVSITTDKGPMIGILKLDYIKNFTHEIQFIDEKIGIGIVPQSAGLPGSGQKIQKAAFIKPFREDDKFNLMILDKQRKSKEDNELGINYFVNDFLYAKVITNERDMTKTFLKAAEDWTRKNISNDASKAEEIRTAVKSSLKEKDSINIDELSQELFKENSEEKSNFSSFVKGKGLDEEVIVDKTWVEKKLKRVRLNIDKQIDIYLNEEVYHDDSKFEIQRNGDGTINLVVKNVNNYIEK
ncbi:nucleoid-associated protein [Clostridium taeniosporum]|uniref:Nucleoid-associated protein n=1 Tax=Clostridium taeniosporum TaxID=394958 RepID=A0A1D7XMX4_9CLOT|nr:nucleoid-associated protein [Clostridium taeniosporum]AOR24469.1 nucleoid-associated protein [Clostridium taeniosporum]